MYFMYLAMQMIWMLQWIRPASNHMASGVFVLRSWLPTSPLQSKLFFFLFHQRITGRFSFFITFTGRPILTHREPIILIIYKYFHLIYNLKKSQCTPTKTGKSKNAVQPKLRCCRQHEKGRVDRRAV